MQYAKPKVYWLMLTGVIFSILNTSTSYADVTCPPGMIADTDLILTVATRTLDNLSYGDTLIALAPPMTVAPFNYVQVWHQRFNEDPAHRWLRDLVRQVSAPSAP